MQGASQHPNNMPQGPQPTEPPLGPFKLIQEPCHFLKEWLWGCRPATAQPHAHKSITLILLSLSSDTLCNTSLCHTSPSRHTGSTHTTSLHEQPLKLGNFVRKKPETYLTLLCTAGPCLIVADMQQELPVLELFHLNSHPTRDSQCVCDSEHQSAVQVSPPGPSDLGDLGTGCGIKYTLMQTG